MLLCHVLIEICLCCVLKLADDRMALVSGISLDPEAAIGVTKKLPPKWIEGIDEVKNIWNWSRNEHQYAAPSECIMTRHIILGRITNSINKMCAAMEQNLFFFPQRSCVVDYQLIPGVNIPN